jgi:hypothetical protein
MPTNLLSLRKPQTQGGGFLAVAHRVFSHPGVYQLIQLHPSQRCIYRCRGGWGQVRRLSLLLLKTVLPSKSKNSSTVSKKRSMNRERKRQEGISTVAKLTQIQAD